MRFEWILMEFMPGTQAYQLWRQLTMVQKTALTEQLADFQSQLLSASSKNNLRGIGNAVDHIDYSIERGPFRSGHNWLEGHLDVTIQDNTAFLTHPDNDGDDVEEIDDIIRIAKNLLDLIPKVFPSIQHPSERTSLRHEEPNLTNILLNDEGKITAVLDWAFLSCQPLWASTRLPVFLEGTAREEEPLRDWYADADTYGLGDETDDSGLDNEGKNELFWIYLLEWEATQLGRVYNARMEQLRPGWDAERADAALKLDFVRAVGHCAAVSFRVRYVEGWANAVAEGRAPDLVEVMRTRGQSLHAANSVEEDADSDADRSSGEGTDRGTQDARADDEDIETSGDLILFD